MFSQYNIRNFGDILNRLEGLKNNMPSTGAIRGPEVKTNDYFTPEQLEKVKSIVNTNRGPDDYFDAEKFKQVQGVFDSAVSKDALRKGLDYFKREGNNAPSFEGFKKYMDSVSPFPQLGSSGSQYNIGNFDKLLNRVEEAKNNIGSDAGQKEAAPQSSSNAPDFLDKFKKDLEAKAENEPATRGGTYAEVTGDTSTRGGRDRSSRGGRKAEFSRRSRRSRNEAQRSRADRAADRARSDYESRRSSSGRGTDFGPGRSRRDASGSSYSDSRRDRSFERRGRSSRNRFGR
jgi:hypothetical protein